METWPFNVPFLIILNMAIGGTMGGSKGVDDSCFPTEFEIDYIRVYQKKFLCLKSEVTDNIR